MKEAKVVLMYSFKQIWQFNDLVNSINSQKWHVCKSSEI